MQYLLTEDEYKKLGACAKCEEVKRRFGVVRNRLTDELTQVMLEWLKHPPTDYDLQSTRNPFEVPAVREFKRAFNAALNKANAEVENI